VLGAFLVGVLSTRVTSAAMLTGMAAGTITVGWIWWTGAAGFTWFALTGALVTSVVALAASFVIPQPRAV